VKGETGGATLPLAFHHVGLATKSMERARAVVEGLGYSVDAVSPVPSQRVRVCFARQAHHPTIELIEPDGDDSPVRTILDHLCYVTPDLGKAEAELRRLKFVPLGEQFVSGPLSDQATRFFYNAGIGVIEVSEEK
jgi:methylmalonyl-CoA/ethylmalonyl-CoA epimerase